MRVVKEPLGIPWWQGKQTCDYCDCVFQAEDVEDILDFSYEIRSGTPSFAVLVCPRCFTRKTIKRPA